MPISNDLNDLESQIKKSKISAASFKKQSVFGSSNEIISIHKTLGNLVGHVRKTVIRVSALEKTVDNQSKKITSLKNISGYQGQQIRGTNIGSKLPGGSADNLNETISTIANAITSIAETLRGQKKTADNARENERKRLEREKRGLAESKLETVFKGVINTAQKIIAPVKSLLDRLLEFIGTIILGRILFKIVGWLGDPKNQDKVKSIIRFVKDWWPALLSAYILFGTSFGRFIRGTVGLLGRFIIQIGKVAIPQLLKFIGRNPVAAGALAVTGTAILANEITGQREAAPIQADNKAKAQTGRGLGVQGVGGVGDMGPTNQYGMLQGAAGGGLIKFGGGGFANLRRFFGLDGGGNAPGYISGEKGVDKIPAMLSDGEFVMSAGAVQKYGVGTLEAMNSAGGGTNRPKIMSGKMYAQGGGYVGPQDDKKEKVKDPILEKQKQSRKALTSGIGITLKGESTGRDLGTGYEAKYKNRDSILVKGGSVNMDLSLTLGGKRYYGMKQGNDAIYTALDRRDTAVPSGGILQPGGLFGGPRMSARMDYAQSKGKYYSSSDQKTYGSYNDAVAAKKSRMTSLASQQRLNKLSSAGANRSSRGVRFEAEAKARSKEFQERGGILGQVGRGLTSMFGTYKDINKNAAADKASDARVKQAGAVSIGRYYSSSDGKYYKDYNAAMQAKKIRLAQQQKKPGVVKPPVKPQPKYNPAGGGMGGVRGAGRTSKELKGGPKTPSFSATTKGSRTKADLIGVHR